MQNHSNKIINKKHLYIQKKIPVTKNLCQLKDCQRGTFFPVYKNSICLILSPCHRHLGISVVVSQFLMANMLKDILFSRPSPLRGLPKIGNLSRWNASDTYMEN